APFDRTQVMTANYVYTLPFFRRGAALPRHVLGGWELSGIVTSYVGQPLSVTTSSVDPAGIGLLNNTSIPNRPDQTCDGKVDAPQQYGGTAQNQLWFTKGCWAAVPNGLVRPGNTGRYTLRGPGFFNWDASLFKN